MKLPEITKEEKDKKLESYEGKILHPSLDIKGQILVLGFRYRAKPQEERDIFLVVKDSSIFLFDGDSIKIDEEIFYLEKKGRKLIRIEEKWSLADLQEFVEKYNEGKSDIVPKRRELLDKMAELAKKYIELEREIDYYLLSVWAIGTYFFPIFYAFPFLNIKAPKRSGKSQCLNFLRQVCLNAIKARPTLAALGDSVDALRGTYLIDQADSLERKGGEELLDILSDSYKKDGGKRRTINFNKSKQREVLEFETYSPKVFASIRELPEDLRDRCLIMPLIRSQKNFHDPDDDNENWREVRGEIYKFLIDAYFIVGSDYDVRKIKYKMNPEITGRELELWLPLEVMLDILGAAEIIEEAKKRFLQWYGFSEYEPSDLEEQVVNVILAQFGDESEITLSPKKISELIESEYFGIQDTPKQKASKVGWAIKKFNLSSEKKPRTREGILYLFEKKKVANIYDSYFSKSLSSSTPEEENSLNVDDLVV
jgi:hypothetical protein